MVVAAMFPYTERNFLFLLSMLDGSREPRTYSVFAVDLIFNGCVFLWDRASRCNKMEWAFLAQDVIYTSRAYATMSVSVCPSACVSVTEVHWHIIANIGSNSDPNLPLIAVAVHAGASTELLIVQWARGKGSSPGKVEGSSCAMLSTARPSGCLYGTTLFTLSL